MRNIFIVNATQCVTSESHPEGLFSVMQGYPKMFDSRNYDATEANPNGNDTAAYNAARSDYYTRLGALYVGSPSRVMATVTLESADGRKRLHASIGSFPDMTPAPEPEPEPKPATDPDDLPINPAEA